MINIQEKRKQYKDQLSIELDKLAREREALNERERRIKTKYAVRLEVLDEFEHGSNGSPKTDAEVSKTETILRLVSEPKTSKEVAQLTGFKAQTVQSALSRLAESGEVKRVGGNRIAGFLYQVVKKGSVKRKPSSGGERQRFTEEEVQQHISKVKGMTYSEASEYADNVGISINTLRSWMKKHVGSASFQKLAGKKPYKPAKKKASKAGRATHTPVEESRQKILEICSVPQSSKQIAEKLSKKASTIRSLISPLVKSKKLIATRIGITPVYTTANKLEGGDEETK